MIDIIGASNVVNLDKHFPFIFTVELKVALPKSSLAYYFTSYATTNIDSLTIIPTQLC